MGCRHVVPAPTPRLSRLCRRAQLVPAGPANPNGTLPGAHEAEVRSLAVEKICHGERRHGRVRRLVFPRTQEVEEGTAEMNCRASRSEQDAERQWSDGAGIGGSFTDCRAERPQGSHAVPDIQQYNRVTE